MKTQIRLQLFVVSIICAVLFFSAWIAFAQDQPKERPILVDSGPWKLAADKPVELRQGSFEVFHEVADKHFRGIVYCAPVLTVFAPSQDERYLGVQASCTAKILEDTPLGNRVWLGYRLARQHLDYPEQHVVKISITLDTGEAKQDASSRFVIPKGARRVERLEIVWAGDENLPIRKIMVWGEATFPWLPLAAFLAALGGAVAGGALWQKKRRKPRPRVVIERPADLTIQTCRQDVVFIARTDPPGREAEIQWEVPLDQQQNTSSGQGPEFTTSWTATGVKQVVARIDGAADDLILYVYKTKNGGATLADILDCEPPLVRRPASDYKAFRTHSIPPDMDDTDEVEA